MVVAQGCWCGRLAAPARSSGSGRRDAHVSARMLQGRCIFGCTRAECGVVARLRLGVSSLRAAMLRRQHSVETALLAEMKGLDAVHVVEGEGTPAQPCTHACSVAARALHACTDGWVPLRCAVTVLAAQHVACCYHVHGMKSLHSSQENWHSGGGLCCLRSTALATECRLQLCALSSMVSESGVRQRCQ